MINRILICTEGTPIMDKITEYVTFLFPEAEFHVVSVVDTSIGTVEVTRALMKLLEERAGEAVEKARKILEKQGVNFTCTTLRGDPSRAIYNYANRHKMDLIVMGASTKSGLVKLTFGHVGEALIRRVHQPLLVINQCPELKKPEKILSPTDGGVHSKEAGKMALFLAGYFGATLYKYYVGKEKEMGKRVLDAAEAWATQVGVKEVNQLALTEEEPADEILRIAQNYDLIVIGKGKKTLFKSNLLGFTSREVAALSPVPVFLVGK